MRRKDREITDNNKINKVIADCHCCRLGFLDGKQVYIVPLNFGYEEKEGHKIFYFHAAKEGRKIELIKDNPSVGFELDANYKLNEGNEACEYSAGFQSIIGTGRVDFIETVEEKRYALQRIMLHNTGKKEWKISDEMIETVAVFKLEVDELSCKEHK